MLTLNPQPAPTWDEPIDMLYACHGKVKRFCSQLRLLPDYLAEHGLNPAAREAAERILIYFDQAAPLHHEDEEADFFPTLLQYAPQAQADVAELARQHGVLHENWAALRCELTALLEQESPSSLKCETIQRFTDAYAVHIDIEEPLFDLGRQTIPQAQRQAIGKIMAARRTA